MTDKGPGVIRVVPMLGAEYRRPPLPKHPGTGLSYNGGPLISNVLIKSIFWGANWQGALSSLAMQINQFLTYIVTSALIDELVEYSVATYPIGRGQFVGTTTVTNPAPASTVTDTEIQNIVNLNKVSLGSKKPRHPKIDQHLYFVFVQDGTVVSTPFGSSCGSSPNGFCGYHSDFSGTFYAVIPYPACSGCAGTLTTFDAITMFSSHELCEAITDPIVPQGWYGQVNGQQGEIGDFCNQQPKTLGGYTVQKLWLNSHGGCV